MAGKMAGKMVGRTAGRAAPPPPSPGAHRQAAGGWRTAGSGTEQRSGEGGLGGRSELATALT